jgi:MFS family permease
MHNERARAPRLFVIGASIATLASVAGWLLAPIEARFISSLTENTALVGVTYAVGTAAFAVLALTLGRVADRIGQGRMVVLCMAVGIVYPLLYASSVNVLTYMGVELLWAVAAVGTGPVLMALLQNLVADHPNRGHLLSLMYGAMSLSGALGHFTGGYVASVFGLTTPYYILALIYVVLLVIALPTLLTAGVNKGELEHTNDEKHGLDASSLLFGMRYVFSKPILVYYFILNSAFAMNYGIKVLLWPLIVVVFIEDPLVMGLIFAGTGVMAFLVLLFSGRVVDARGVHLGIHLAWASLVLGGFTMALTGSYVWFAIGALVFTIGEAFYGSAQAVLLTDNVARKHRAEILGVDRIFDSSFTTAAMLISGALLAIIGPQHTWFVFMVVLVLSYCIAMLYRANHGF